MTPSPDSGVKHDAPPRPVVAAGALLGGRYELASRLGEGGMGVVYRAHDRMLRRTVAVKVFRDGAAESARTATEVHLLAGLNHPSLVTLYDAHVGEAPRYLVMEHVNGPTLAERLTSGPLDPQTTAGMARDLGAALQAVHAAGIVHRDIKPSNVLLRSSTFPGEEFHAKLADFGIAYLTDSARVTTPGLVVGSAAYLSPEQVRGADPAPAADIYSLGLLLIECLTGRRAFPQTDLNEAVIVRLSQDPVVPASVGHDWGDLLTKMTNREPAERPTAQDVINAVADLRVGVEVEVERTVAVAGDASPPIDATLELEPVDEPTLLSHRAARRRRHVRWLMALIFAILAAIALVVGLMIWGGSSAGVLPPGLPDVQEPLQSHLQQLLDAVTP